MTKHVLMTAYHYPPCQGGSGSLRTLNFTRHLPRHGWTPIVLTANTNAYPDTANDLLREIPADAVVQRAFSLDTARHLALGGRYLDWMALPDRWVSWVPGGVATGLRLIRKYKPNLIWSTYPIASSLWIGYFLQKMTSLPWIVDFRDPLVELDPRTKQWHPHDKKLLRARQAIERRAVENSTRTVLVTPGSKRIYAERYSQLPESHWAVIPNGFEEEIFSEVEREAPPAPPPNGGPMRLLHSGLLYPTPDRDPTAFFSALSSLKKAGTICSRRLQVILRASGSQDHYTHLIQQFGLQEIVRLEPAIPYREALKEMLGVDGLLVFQGYTSNPAIPAKLYEYLRARRPILAMVDAEGDTAATLRSAGAGEIVPLESPDQIAAGLVRFMGQVRDGAAAIPDPQIVKGFAREARAVELAALLDQVASERSRRIR